MAGIYVHVPFCRRRCLYCDFYTVGDRLAVWPDYVSALLAEAARRVPPLLKCASGDAVEDATSRTLYIGGGTPSLVPADQFSRLADGLIGLTGVPEEFTIEVNPDDVTPALVDAWHDAGVNRVSMGVQSLIDSELRMIGRRHDAAGARRAFELLRTRFDNISLDLMFGLPGQSVESLLESVDGLIGMKPEHVSAYSLMYEERSALTRLRDAGKITEIPEEDSSLMFESISRRLAAAGYEQYEISNYARPGYRSRHNSAYWRGEPYVGLGPGAHSYDGLRTRIANSPDYRAYMNYWSVTGAAVGKDSVHPVEIETLSDDELREEMIMTRLRTREGVSLREYERRFGEAALRAMTQAAAPWLKSGDLRFVQDIPSDANTDPAPGQLLALTSSGVMISDEIILSLF